MIVSQADVRSRIEQLKLSYEGYQRQLAHLELSPERRERLQIDVRLLKEELTTLETLAQFGRVEPDRDKIEASVRERLEHVRARLASDPALHGYGLDERDQASGEVRALLWALGEDTLTRYTRELAQRRDADPSRTNRALATLLIQAIENGPDTDTRASAAYDAGKLHFTEAIPALANALGGDAFVAGFALNSLASFSEQELTVAGLDGETLTRIVQARTLKMRNAEC